MQHVIAWRFWSFFFNRRQGVIGRVIKLSLLPSVKNTSLFSRYHPILKFIGFVPGFSCFVRDEQFVQTGFCSLLFENWLDHFLLFIFSFLLACSRRLKWNYKLTNPAICWLYLWTFIMLNLDHIFLITFVVFVYIQCTPVYAIILLLNWKGNRLPPLLPKLLKHLIYN